MPDRRDLTPTRSTLLELADEKHLVREGYEFLDEKRILLASELLGELARYKTLYQRYLENHQVAARRLTAAVQRHGHDGIAVYPALDISASELRIRRSRFLGVAQVAATLELAPDEPRFTPVNPSPEARECRASFARLLPLAAQLAAMAGNLERLMREYARTERRARALENVLMPEIDESLKFVTEQLEALDQEEAVRVRQAHGSATN